MPRTRKLIADGEVIGWRMVPVTASPSARILCQRGDGIGCRLLTLLWTLRLARKADAGVLMFWPSLDQLGYHGSGAGDIFDLYRLASPEFWNRLQILDGDCKNYFQPNPIFLNPKRQYEKEDFVVPDRADPRRHDLPVIYGGWLGPILMVGESREEALAEMPALFSELPFRHDLMSEVDRITRKLQFSNRVAVHVRRGEIAENLRVAVSDFRHGDQRSEGLLNERIGTFFRRCLSAEHIAVALREFADQGQRVVVFSDDPAVNTDLSESLDAGFRVRSAAALIEIELTPIQLAFVEVVLMSKCRLVVGARSAFSRLANLIGGNEHLNIGAEQMSAKDTVDFMLRTISDQLASHPDKLHIERQLHEEVVRLRG